jgi:hypothetical protein
MATAVNGAAVNGASGGADGGLCARFNGAARQRSRGSQAQAT